MGKRDELCVDNDTLIEAGIRSFNKEDIASHGQRIDLPQMHTLERCRELWRLLRPLPFSEQRLDLPLGSDAASLGQLRFTTLAPAWVGRIPVGWELEVVTPGQPLEQNASCRSPTT
jgi:hypothetical protein